MQMDFNRLCWTYGLKHFLRLTVSLVILLAERFVETRFSTSILIRNPPTQTVNVERCHSCEQLMWMWYYPKRTKLQAKSLNGRKKKKPKKRKTRQSEKEKKRAKRKLFEEWSIIHNTHKWNASNIQSIQSIQMLAVWRSVSIVKTFISFVPCIIYSIYTIRY